MASSKSSSSSKAAAPKAAAKTTTKAPAVNTNPKTNGGIYQYTLPAKPATSAGAGTNIGFNTKTIIPVTKKTTTVDYSKMQSKAPVPVNKFTQSTIDNLKGNNIVPTLPGQMQSYAPVKKTNPVASVKGIASGPNQNMSVAPAPKAKSNPTSLKNSSSMFEALPGYSDPFGSVFKAPDYSNAMSKINSAKGEQYQSKGNGKAVDPKTQRAMEAKLVASGKNSQANAAALREQLDSLGYDSSFIKTDYSNYNKNLLDANRMNQTNKLKGQNSDPETAKLLASFGNQSKTTQQKLAELSALLSKKGDKDAEKNAQILLSNLDATNQDVKASYNIDVNKALVGAGAMADLPLSTVPTTAAKIDVKPTADTTNDAPADQYMSSVESPAGTGTIAQITYTPGIPGIGTIPKTTTTPTPVTPQKDTTADPTGTGTMAGMPTAPKITTPAVDDTKETTTDTTGSIAMSQAQYDKFVAATIAKGKTQADADAILEQSGYTKPVAADTDASITKPITAPNGKAYNLTITPEGKVGFVNINGDMQYFQNYDAAVGYINSKNPVGSKGGEANVLKAGQPGETMVVEDNKDTSPRQTEFTANQAEYNDNKKRANLGNIAAANNAIQNEISQAKAAGDTTRANNMNILSSQFTGVQNLFDKIDGLVNGVADKSLELFDRGSMRAANARAQQMADKGYLTSDQVAQVANYSVANYKRDVDLKRVDVEKQLAEKKIELAQNKEKMIQDIQANQMTTNDAKLAQVNFVTKMFNDAIASFQDKEDQTKQFYDAQTGAIQGMESQANVAANSLIQQDNANNQVQQNMKARALTDDTARTDYILSRIPDQALHAYALKAIDGLIKAGKYMSTQNLEGLASQVANAALAYQQAAMKALK